MLLRRLAKDERGAEALEFALVFPVLAFIIFGLIYGLLAASAHVSLAHATARGVRYASLSVDPVAGLYPTTDQVAAKVDSNTPFFAADACVTTVAGEARENAPVTVDVACDFPNPLGSAISAIGEFFSGSDSPDAHPDEFTISAHAEARRE